MERSVFGEHSLFQYFLDKEKIEAMKARFLKKLKHHKAVQKLLGCATMNGMVDPDYKVKAELHDDEGVEREFPRSYSFWDLCFKMRAGDVRLWQGILPNSSGDYNGHFSGMDPDASIRATEFADDSAGCMKCFLM